MRNIEDPIITANVKRMRLNVSKEEFLAPPYI
jgi:hypothetical protein